MRGSSHVSTPAHTGNENDLSFRSLAVLKQLVVIERSHDMALVRGYVGSGLGRSMETRLTESPALALDN